MPGAFRVQRAPATSQNRSGTTGTTMPSTPEIVDATVMTGSVGWIQDVLYPWVSPAWLMAFVMIALGLFAFHSVRVRTATMVGKLPDRIPGICPWEPDRIPDQRQVPRHWRHTLSRRLRLHGCVPRRVELVEPCGPAVDPAVLRQGLTPQSDPGQQRMAPFPQATRCDACRYCPSPVSTWPAFHRATGSLNGSTQIARSTSPSRIRNNGNAATGEP